MDAPIQRVHYSPEPIGMGSYSTVWRAEDILAEKVWVEKHPTQSPIAASLIAREYGFLSAFNCPAIVKVLSLECYDLEGVKIPYLRMECLGSQISEYAGQPDKVIPLLATLFSAFTYMSKRRIVHRDIKPANIKVTSSGQAKLYDFGISKFMDLRGGIEPGLGTLSYNSPEQARGESVDHSTDIFALAAIIYQLLTGMKIYDDDRHLFSSLLSHNQHRVLDRMRILNDCGYPQKFVNAWGLALDSQRERRQEGFDRLEKEVSKTILLL